MPTPDPTPDLAAITPNQELAVRLYASHDPRTGWLNLDPTAVAAFVTAYDAQATRLADLETVLRTTAAVAADAEQRLAAVEQALRTIRDTYGQVCQDFELCMHAACQSSYGAWPTADEALKGAPDA